MTSDHTAERLRMLGDRAANAGYRMVRDPAHREAWSLLDAEDGEIILPATTLDRIAQWLSG
ncbi:hypothetical protein [Nocardia veterana]|uniref:Uncharacterized protein n=1 Tax=Nocardia veterana TaxID=132249 RepID=A0A7X6M3C0_9NOCA|nr:hypothetical protein [Nocardia veterana]NKY88979.1 hypothetical protein [Nocardia veterana]